MLVKSIDFCRFTRALPLAKKTASLINKRNYEKANIEYRTMNIECRRNVFYLSY
ncbi:hypothetical protein D1AOALGA4SA_10124 [Olavius algarvensis Delta 1 endosymbiont]|nr:hypothetical protein D1AOALGA4SA_10124 [Olavius algarvensis Delta 1 endosymbiont]